MNLLFAYLKTTNRQLHICIQHTQRIHIFGVGGFTKKKKELEGNIIVKSLQSEAAQIAISQ